MIEALLGILVVICVIALAMGAVVGIAIVYSVIKYFWDERKSQK